MNLSYYIKNAIISLIGLCILAVIVQYGIFDSTQQQFENIGTVIGLIVAFIGTMAIGYFNIKSASGDKFKQSFYLHLILIIFFFSIDILFGQFDFIIAFLRNMTYFVALTLGAYLYTKNNRHKN